MNILRNHLILVLVACAWFFNGCTANSTVSYHIIHIEGVTWACNVSSSYVSFGSTTESGESGKVSLPVSDGDLLYLFNDDDLELYYRYKPEDGNLLAVSFDTINTNSAHVNGMLAFLEITDNPSSWDAFKGLSSSEVNQLSTLYISDNLTAEILEVLKVHESSLPGTGLVLEDKSEGGILKERLSFYRPGWLGLDGGVDLSDVNHDDFLSGLKLLWISDDIQAVSNMLHCCTNLESLIITDWEPSKGELITLAGLKNLHSLTLADCYITDLSNLEFPSSLERLHLIGCDTLTDIKGLDQIPNLISLSLKGSDDVEFPEAISKFGSLKWISFPANTTQDAFQSILKGQQSLEVVEMINCPLVSNISLLQDQTNLKVLIFSTKDYDLNQLTELDQAELIILNSTLFEDSPELISQLRSELPDTEIFPGSGLCLGSGWLLMLLPLVLLTRILLRKGSQS